MIRRYDLSRSDNYMYTGKVTAMASGSGIIFVYTGFPVTRATVSFATIPCSFDTTYSSSSSSSSEESTDIPSCSRIYVSSYTSTGFNVTYEGIPEEVGYIEFSYSAV